MTLQRHTPLAAGKPLAPVSAKRLAAGPVWSTFLPRNARASKPKRPRDTGPSRGVRQIVADRSGRRCEWPACVSRASDVHHRLNRKSGGRHGEAAERINGAAWLLACCRAHHSLVTDPVGDVRKLAESMGWVLREHQDAEATPVLTRHYPAPVLLANDGTWTLPEAVAS